MNIDIDKLSAEDKNTLLVKLMYDKETQPFMQAEFTKRIDNVLKKLYNQIEKYFLEQDEENKRICDNMWKTTIEGWVLTGVGKACARIKRILDEIRETRFDNDCYDTVYRDIHEAKNRIMDNQISQKARGTRAYHTILRYEGQIADILEHMWSYAFQLGMLCRARTLTDKEIEELDKKERDIAYQLSRGCYNKERFLSNMLNYINEDKKEREARQIINMIPLNPDEHPEVMEFLKKL